MGSARFAPVSTARGRYGRGRDEQGVGCARTPSNGSLHARGVERPVGRSARRRPITGLQERTLNSTNDVDNVPHRSPHFKPLGEVVETVGTAGRATIANMIIDSGATTAVSPSDEQTRRWRPSKAASRISHRWPPAAAPTTTRASASSCPNSCHSSPGRTHRARRCPSPSSPIPHICVGSSVNSSCDDLAIIETGVYQDLIAAGGRILEPVCGPSVGIGQAPLQGAASLRTFTRNFPGRSGSRGPSVSVQLVRRRRRGDCLDRTHHRPSDRRPTTAPDPARPGHRNRPDTKCVEHREALDQQSPYSGHQDHAIRVRASRRW